MIHYTLGQKILNRMLLTGGVVGSSAEEDADMILGCKFLQGASHPDWLPDNSDEYTKCAYYKLRTSAKELEKSNKYTGEDAESDVEVSPSNNPTATKNQEQWVKIPVFKDHLDDGTVIIKIDVARIISTIGSATGAYNTGDLTKDGSIAYYPSSFTSTSVITSIVNQLKTGINKELGKTGFFSTATWKEADPVDVPSYKYTARTFADREVTWYTSNDKKDSKIIKVIDSTEQREQTFSGTLPKYYYLEASSVQTSNYPAKAFIGLFTTMPNASGIEYVEPTPNSPTNPEHTYRRMNLHEDLFQGEYVFNDAEICSEGEHAGKAMLTNKAIIMFPEVQKESWGKIIGFGVFEEENAGEGVPYFWGRVENPKTASTDTVPLFRIGDFQVYLG